MPGSRGCGVLKFKWRANGHNHADGDSVVDAGHANPNSGRVPNCNCERKSNGDADCYDHRDAPAQHFPYAGPIGRAGALFVFHESTGVGQSPDPWRT